MTLLAVEEVDRSIQVVVKVSKHCNLRCRYCYEFPHLADRRRLSREQLQALYRNLRREIEAGGAGRCRVSFVWHGGEPLLIPPAYYRDTFADQAQIFAKAGCEIVVRNDVQTNLTVLDAERLELLGLFDGIGVSLDVFGDLRVDTSGRVRDAQVARNMDELSRRGMDFGAICVLSRANVDRVEDIYGFFGGLGISFRLLTIHQGADATQNSPYDLATEEIIDALKRLYGAWIVDPNLTSVSPVAEQVMTAARHVGGGGSAALFCRRDWINILLVDTDGECYGYSDDYGNPAASYGPIASEGFPGLFTSPTYLASSARAEQRMAMNCTSCEFFGHCSGHAVADSRHNERDRWDNGVDKCVIERALLRHIAEDLAARFADSSPAQAMPVIRSNAELARYQLSMPDLRLTG